MLTQIFDLKKKKRANLRKWIRVLSNFRSNHFYLINSYIFGFGF